MKKKPSGDKPEPAIPTKAPTEGEIEPTDNPSTALQQRHLGIGWWALLLFLSLGLALEALHGFKVGEYLKVSNETRRLMWTLAHAHGTLLALVNLAFVATLTRLTSWRDDRRQLASSCLVAATALMPAGFFLGGVYLHAGDPGLGILLVPIAGIFLFVAVFLTALAVRSTGADG